MKLSTLTGFVKLEHTLFSLPLIFAGAFLANGRFPSLRLSILMILAGAGARVVALALNRIIDRHIDAKNPRTQDRHLTNGSMKLFEAWIITFVALALYLISVWLISDFCLKWSWIPLIGFAAYPFFKRFTKWTHVGLGIVWSVIPIAGYLAVKPSFDISGPTLLLAVFSVFWLAGFDIIYATMDEKYDKEAGLFSLPACWGAERAVKMAGVFHALSFLALLAIYGIWFQGPLTVMLLAAIGVLLFMEQRFSHNVDLAFFKINAVIGFAIFAFVISGVKGY